MDMFKLLSRSTKLAQSFRNTQPQQTLPSGGQNANPQLFGREELPQKGDGRSSGIGKGDTVLGKRKRKGEKVVVDQVPAELDFFGEKSAKGGVKGGMADAKRSWEDTVRDVEQQQEEEMLNEKECKAILKAHKVKITALSEPVLEHEFVNCKKSKSQDEKNSVPPPPSRSRTQTFLQPLTSFAQLRTRYGISKRLAENIAHQGYKLPTEVQLAALPLLMGDPTLDFGLRTGQREGGSAVDLLAVAPTGSGKTLAFLIPILNTLFLDKRMDQDSEPQAIIIAPTRELASQIVNEGRKLVERTGIRISLVRKGMSIGIHHDDDSQSLPINIQHQIHDSGASSDEEGTHGTLGKKATYAVKSHILVSTPLTLLHGIEAAGAENPSLPSIRFLVLDEADVLLDSLFQEQTLSIWKACTNSNLRTSLWSATMGSNIETLALQHISKNGTDLQHEVPILRLVVGLKDTALPNITHLLTYAATETGKLLALRQLLHPTAPKTDSSRRQPLRPPFLVFTQTIERAKALHAELKYDIPPEAGGSSRIAALHSDMSETARGKVMAAFRRGEIWVIITTDLLARGIDFRGLNGVVNYDVPTSAAAYVHRVGRTGRAGREGGVAVTLYTKDDVPHIKPVANVIAASEKLRENSKGNERSTVQQWLLDALPTPSKRDKQELKRKGVESRRAGTKTARISTKSKLNRAMGAKKGDQVIKSSKPKTMNLIEADDFAGFSD